MHEVSIVKNILEIVNQEVQREKANKVEQIDLDIGVLAGIEMEALIFAWEACVPNTVLANAKRVINHLAAKARCISCGHEFEVEEYFTSCPICKETLTKIMQGKELKIKSLLVS